MPNTPQVNFKVINNAINPTTPAEGIMFVSGVTQKGPFGDASKVITSWPQFTKLFGGQIAGSDFPLICKRAFESGATLRVNRQGHYTTISDASTLDAVKAALVSPIVDGTPDTMFTLAPKYEGVDYNNLITEIKAASNGMTNYFDLEISMTNDSNVTELYKNINIPGTPTVAASTFLADVIANSALVDVTYLDLSALAGPLRPIDAIYTYAGGTDGTAPTDADYTGDATGATGFHAFDEYDDAYFIAAPTQTSSVMALAGTNYASNREDIIYLHHIANTLVTAAAIEAFRTGTAIDDDAMAFIAGGLRVTDPVTSLPIEIAETGDILGLSATTQSLYDPWISFAGSTKGLISNAFGVVTNFGSVGKFDDLNLLANRQVNMVVVKNGQLYLNSGFTGVLTESPLSFISTKVLILYIKKTLRPVLESYIEEPSDMPTFKEMADEVKVILDSLVDNRALTDYEWNGDQDATTVADMQLNNPADVQQGRYKVDLKIITIQPLQEVEVSIIITPAGVTFS